MAYALYRFGDVILPDRIPEDSLYTGDVESTLLDSVGGVFDYFGARQRLPRQLVIPHKGRYLGERAYIVDHAGNQIIDHAGNRLVNGTATGQLVAQVDALRERLGQRDRLWRRRDSDGVLQWKLARLMRVDGADVIENIDQVVDLTLAFETSMAAWRSATATMTSLGGGSGNRALTVNVRGSAPVSDAVIAITAAATVTSIRVQHGDMGVDWTWAGALASGQILTIDAGAQTVRIGSANAYSGLAYNAAHRARGLLPLRPGTNGLMITSDASASVSLTHYDQWL